MFDERKPLDTARRGPSVPRETRTNRFLSARLETAAGSRAVTVRNISPCGALLEGSGLPAPGTVVRLTRDHLFASGKVVWRRDRRCGLRLDEPIRISQWMGKNSNIGKSTIDTALGLLDPVDEDTPGPGLLASVHGTNLINCIELLETQLATLSDALIASPVVLSRHAVHLQALDTLAQGLAHLRTELSPVEEAA